MEDEDDERIAPKARKNGLASPWSWQQQVAMGMILSDGIFFSLVLAPAARRGVVDLFYLSWLMVCASGLLLMSNDPSEPLSRPSEGGEDLWCRHCCAPTTADSKHCFECNKCVPGFDHHCPWLNACIGGNNYNTFACAISSVLFMLCVFLVGAVEVAAESNCIKIIVIICFAIPNILFLLMDGILTSLHCYLAYNRMTTHELVLWMRQVPISHVGPCFAALYLFLQVDAVDGDAKDLLDVVRCKHDPKLDNKDEEEEENQNEAAHSSESSSFQSWGDRPSRKNSWSENISRRPSKKRSLSEDVMHEVSGFLLGSGDASDPAAYSHRSGTFDENCRSSTYDENYRSETPRMEWHAEGGDADREDHEQVVKEDDVLLHQLSEDPPFGWSASRESETALLLPDIRGKPVTSPKATFEEAQHSLREARRDSPAERTLSLARRDNDSAAMASRRWLVAVSRFCSQRCQCQ